MNQTDYQADANRGPSNSQNPSAYSQYQWQQQQHQQQQQQPNVVTSAAYDHDMANGSGMEETSRLLSNVFNTASKGPSASTTDPFLPQSYQQPKHSSIPATAGGLSVFQDTSLWTTQEWMTNHQKRDENGSVPRYSVDEVNDNKRMKFADWGRSTLPMTIDEESASMASRAASYQISDDVVQMFNSTSVMGLSADHHPAASVDLHRSQVPNPALQMQIDNFGESGIEQAFDDGSYEPISEGLMRQPHQNPASMNGSQNRLAQAHHSPNAPFPNVYIRENNGQNNNTIDISETSYIYPDHHQQQSDDHQHMQSFSPSNTKPAATPRQPNVFNYGNRYPDVEEQKKRSRESYGNLAGTSTLIQDDLQPAEDSRMPKRFRLNVHSANPNLNANPQFAGGNNLYTNTESGSGISAYGLQPGSMPSTATLEQTFAANPSAAPKARAPHIKLVVKPPKPMDEDLEDDEFSETHITETTVRQTASGKPQATERAINQCSFVTDKTMLDTISVRKCNYLINQVMSAGCCLPFVLPVPKFLVLYHNVITNPSDLMTVEKKLWNSGYSSTDEFHNDFALIWRNAELFHKNGGDIADKAQVLKQVYFDALQQLDSESSGLQWTSDSRLIAAEEQHFDAKNMAQLNTDNKTVLYVMRGVDIGEKPRVRSFTPMAEIFEILNAQFYDSVKAMKDHEDGGDSDPNQLPLPRLFISKNRTMLEFAASDPKAVLTVLINVSVQKCTEPHKKGLFHVRADAVLVHPLGNRHDLDQLQWPEKINQAEFAPRAWIKVKILKIVRGFEIDVTDKMEKEIFRRVYTTTRLGSDPRESPLHNSIAKLFVKSAIGVPLGPEDTIEFDNQKPKPIEIKKPHTAVASIAASSSKLVAETVQPEIKPVISEGTAMDVDTSPSAPTEEPLPHKADTATISEVKAQRNDNKSLQEDRGRVQIQEQLDFDQDQEEDQDKEEQDQDYDYEDEGSYSKGAEEEPSQDVTSISGSLSQTPLRQEEAITFMRCIDNENEAAEKDKKQLEDENMRAIYRERSKAIWDKLVSMSGENDISVINVKKYTENVSTFPNAEGYFKQVYYVSNDPTVVVQTFRHMTMYQRITELVCLLKLRNKRHIGQMVEVLKEDEGEVIGLSMVRYQQTLKKYAHVHSHHRLSAHQKYHIIWQMLLSMKTIHDVGLAHRDLSEVNIMVNEVPNEVLEDGTLRPELFLIDFGKAIFCQPEDVRSWWCEVPRMEGDYEGDVVPETREEMEAWCESLPWVKGKPDHGYKMYRSIQTLPKTRSDSDVLPYMIHPQKEDMYSIGVIIWKTFAETEPWEGVLDTDIKGLRYMVEDDFRIEKSVNKDVPGEYSRKLLFSCLKTSPHERQTATEILEWFERPSVKAKLIEEWTLYAPEKRANRRAKTMYGRDNSGESEVSHARGRRRGRGAGGARGSRGGGSGRGRGRPRGSVRKVGRPRKVIADAPGTRDASEPLTSRETSEGPGTREASVASEASENTTNTSPAERLPKRPGRPRKQPIPDEPRRVGRPRKYPLPEPPQEDSKSSSQAAMMDQEQEFYALYPQEQSPFASQTQAINAGQGYVSYVPAEWRNELQSWPPQS